MNIGCIGEIAVMKHLALQGYDVYAPVADNPSYDLVAMKDGKPLVIEVKTSNSKSKNGKKWRVRLDRKKHNFSKGHYTQDFDSTNIDLLGIYIQAEDRVIMMNAKDIKTKTETSVAVLEKSNYTCNHEQEQII